ncbi:MAG: hypothetical protein CW338_10085 [Clostridiales bacterium]|nr:hypothetical protein [Clostridiales bacterium]
MKKTWFRLDNAGKLYPAVSNRKWSAVYRISAEMDTEVDAGVLQQALNDILPRFPSMNARLRRGLFWCYLEENPWPMQVREDSGHPCMRFLWKEDRGHLVRVTWFHSRISAEFFHSLCDGGGALVMFKTLLARYCELRGEEVEYNNGAVNYLEEPSKEELEDTFLKMPLPRARSARSASKAWHYPATKEVPHTLHLVSALLDGEKLRMTAKEKGATINEYMTAVMLWCAYRHQVENTPVRRQRPVRVQVPVNMRVLYPSKTLRNFSTYVMPEIDPALGEYTFDEVLERVQAFMKYFADPKFLYSAISANVADERKLIVRFMPLFIKHFAISAVFRQAGARITTATFSNLGRITMPSGADKHVTGFEAVLGPSERPLTSVCMATCAGQMRLTFSRNIRETDFIREVLCFLVEKGISVTVRTNREVNT